MMKVSFKFFPRFLLSLFFVSFFSFFLLFPVFRLSALSEPIHRNQCYLTFSVQGEFSDRGGRNVNLLNAPPQVVDQKVSPLKVSKEMLQVLNQNKEKLFQEALETAGLKQTKDCFYKMRLGIAGNNNQGGYYSGLTVRLTLFHLQTPQIYTGLTEVKIGNTEAKTLAYLKSAYLQIINQAFGELHSEAVKMKY